jgi:tetratricopeptide (TPR) repeat protein
MTNWLLRIVGVSLVMSSLAGSREGAIWGQDPAPGPGSCIAESGHPASLAETENLVRAEVYGRAECKARQLIAAQPDSAEAHYLLGYILNRNDKPDESLKEYTAGAKLRHPSSNDLAVVALDYALLKDYTDAAKWMNQALAGEPGNAQYWYYLGRIQYSLNAFDDARTAFEKSLSLRPNDVHDLYNLGLTYEGLGQPETAIELYRQAITNDGASDAQPFYDLGSLLARENRTDEALPLLEKAAELEPRNPGILEGVAKAEGQLGHLQSSRKHLELAVILQPNVSSLHFELGHVYQKLQMATAAKQQFKICGTLAGTHSSVGSDSLDFAKP